MKGLAIVAFVAACALVLVAIWRGWLADLDDYVTPLVEDDLDDVGTHRQSPEDRS